MVSESVYTESGECREDDEDCRPTVVEREWEVDEDLVCCAFGFVTLLDDVVNVGDGARDEEGENKRCSEFLVRWVKLHY